MTTAWGGRFTMKSPEPRWRSWRCFCDINSVLLLLPRCLLHLLYYVRSERDLQSFPRRPRWQGEVLRSRCLDEFSTIYSYRTFFLDRYS